MTCDDTTTAGSRAVPGLPAGDRAILALFQALNQHGATIVIITHDTGIARRMPRRIEMLDGRIVADTTAVSGTFQPPEHP